jgi:cytochrome c556
VALVVALVGASAVRAQDRPKKYPLFSADDFGNAMKIVGRAFGSVNTAIGTGDHETAKAQLARAREQLAVTVTYWRDRQATDALRLLKDTLSGMDALDDALSAAAIDGAAVSAAARQVGTGCQGCHQSYREQDPATKAFRFKLERAR